MDKVEKLICEIEALDLKQDTTLSDLKEINSEISAGKVSKRKVRRWINAIYHDIKMLHKLARGMNRYFEIYPIARLGCEIVDELSRRLD